MESTVKERKVHIMTNLTTKTYLELNDALGKCVDELYYTPRERTDDVFGRRAQISSAISKAIRKMAHNIPEDEAQEIIKDTLKELVNARSSY